MKKLHHRKGAVHPTPPPAISDHLLTLLPTSILIMTAPLSPEEKQVLAYLISCSSTNPPKSTNKLTDHAPCFNCNCFRCYMTYWVKWDSSPNRHLIDQIIDTFELKDTKKKAKKERNKVRKGNNQVCEDEVNSLVLTESDSAVEMSLAELGDVEESNHNVVVEEEIEVEEKGGSVRRFMGFLGGRIWSVWG